MCKHQGISEQSGSYTTFSSFLWLNRTLRGITWQYTLLGKQENTSSIILNLIFLAPRYQIEEQYGSEI